MTKEENSDEWISWLVDAIHKIKQQKQRPNVERVGACIRLHHPQFSNEIVFKHLEELVKGGHIKRHEKKENSGGARRRREERERERREKIEMRREQKKEKEERKLLKKQHKNESPQKPEVVPICAECLGTASYNPSGDSEQLISCSGCGQSVHPSCRIYSKELVSSFQQDGWCCDDCKICIVCDQSDDLVVCEFCDQGIHYSCLDPQPDERHESWNCDDCRITKGMEPKGNIKKFAPLSEGQEESLLPDHLTTPPPALTKFSLQRRRKKRENVTVLPAGVTEKDVQYFTKSQENEKAFLAEENKDLEDVADIGDVMNTPSCKVQVETIDATTPCATPMRGSSGEGPDEGRGGPHLRTPQMIQFGRFDITTWYSSPYPQEYARLPKLSLCEFCLKYMKSRSILDRHISKCPWRHPPGLEIYRKDSMSVFEVDGNTNKIYCQNLCLLVKLFLDHKTLYYDVEPFLFYVLTHNDSNGSHLVAYFSKEKHCLQKFNVSCIMTMPHCQRKGYGRMLIDFSYLLSKVEKQPGTPEKPLSDLGKLSYHSYWKSIVLEYLAKIRGRGHITIQQLSADTSLHPHDVALAFMLLGFIKKDPDKENKYILAIDWTKVDNHMAKVKNTLRIELDPDTLIWQPLPPPGILVDSPLKSEPSEGESSDEKDVEDKAGMSLNVSSVKEEDKSNDDKVSSERKLILTTESDPTDKQLGKCAELAGGASSTSKLRYNSSITKRLVNRSILNEYDKTSGDSADGEPSEDEPDDSTTKSTENRTPKSSNNMISPRKRSSLRSRNTKDRTINHLNTEETSEEDENPSGKNETCKSRVSRHVTEEASAKVTEVISKQDSDIDESSTIYADDAKELNLRQRELKSSKLQEDELKYRAEEVHEHTNSSQLIDVSNKSLSDHSEDMKPKIEPQAKLNTPSPYSKKFDKQFKKDDKRKQKSIMEFFSSSPKRDSLQAVHDDVSGNNLNIKEQHANFEGKDAVIHSQFLNESRVSELDTSMNEAKESKENNIVTKEVRSEVREEKTYTLIASTLHPKRVLKEEQNKEKRKVDQKIKEDRTRTEEEQRDTKRKGRDWDENGLERNVQQKKDLSERHENTEFQEVNQSQGDQRENICQLLVNCG